MKRGSQPDMAAQVRPRLTPWGILLFTREVCSRAVIRTGLYQPLPLAFLKEEDEGTAAPAPQINLNLTVQMKKPKKEPKTNAKEKAPPPAERRVLEQLLSLELRNRYLNTQKIQFPQFQRELNATVKQTMEQYFSAEKGLKSSVRPSEWDIRLFLEQAAKVLAKKLDGWTAGRRAYARGAELAQALQHSAPWGVQWRSADRLAEPAKQPAFSRAALNRDRRFHDGRRETLPPVSLQRAAVSSKSAAHSVRLLPSQMLTVPPAGGWTPQWRQAFFPNRDNAGSILFPDVLRMRRAAASERIKPDGEITPEWSAQNDFIHALRQMVIRTIQSNQAGQAGAPAAKAAELIYLETRDFASPPSREKAAASPPSDRMHVSSAVKEGHTQRAAAQAPPRRQERDPQAPMPGVSAGAAPAGLRPIQTVRPGIVQSRSPASAPEERPGQSAIADRPELTFLRQRDAAEDAERSSEAAESETASGYVKSLPTWAQELLRKPGGTARPAGSFGFSAPRQDVETPFVFARNGHGGAGAAEPAYGGQIHWTAPGTPPAFRPQFPDAAAHPAPIQWKTPGENPGPSRQLSEAELRRTADRVYRLIEERLRRELRRSGR